MFAGGTHAYGAAADYGEHADPRARFEAGRRLGLTFAIVVAIPVPVPVPIPVSLAVAGRRCARG